jgi:hypothetical protein
MEKRVNSGKMSESDMKLPTNMVSKDDGDDGHPDQHDNDATTIELVNDFLVVESTSAHSIGLTFVQANKANKDEANTFLKVLVTEDSQNAFF